MEYAALLGMAIVALMLAQDSNSEPIKRKCTVPNNLAIPVKLEAQVSANTLKAGTELKSYTVYDIPVEGGGKIPKGCTGIFVCTEVVQPRVLGQEACISLTAREIQIGRNERLFVRGDVVVEGESLQIESLGIGAAFCCLGFLIPGGDAEIGKGVVLTAFAEGDGTIVIVCEEKTK